MVLDAKERVVRRLTVMLQQLQREAVRRAETAKGAGRGGGVGRPRSTSPWRPYESLAGSRVIGGPAHARGGSLVGPRFGLPPRAAMVTFPGWRAVHGRR